MREIVKVLENVKALAKLNGINVKALENELGYAPGYLSRSIKEGGKHFTFENVLQVCSKFNVTINDLMTADYPKELERVKLVEEHALQLEKLKNIQAELDKLGEV